MAKGQIPGCAMVAVDASRSLIRSLRSSCLGPGGASLEGLRDRVALGLRPAATPAWVELPAVGLPRGWDRFNVWCRRCDRAPLSTAGQVAVVETFPLLCGWLRVRLWVGQCPRCGCVHTAERVYRHDFLPAAYVLPTGSLPLHRPDQD